MPVFSRIAEFLLLMIFYNLVPLCDSLSLPLGVKICGAVLLSLFFIAELFRSEKYRTDNRKLNRIYRGCNLMALSGWASTLEVFAVIWAFSCLDISVGVKIGAIAMPVVTIAATLFLGIVRIIISARQIKIIDYIGLLIFWWVPIINIFLFRKFYKTAHRELIFEGDRIELENARAESRICATRYPIVMVHGIFFRDWQFVNYWGRIPAALIRNGASVFYGRQESSAPVARSAEELRKTILDVLAETGAEKVNIIAHSKGGLDSRYAVSRLGMDKYVATITTINTPHLGCDMVDYLLDKLPQGIVNFVTGRYNKIFSKLGDKSPDFMGGVSDLSARNAVKFNEGTPDSPNVRYRSYMSVMSSAKAAGFPLNVGYLLIKKLNGANDGLVWEKSAVHGDFTLIPTPKKRGISHGDVIDLMRENIDGYDVREFYVDIVRELAESGF